MTDMHGTYIRHLWSRVLMMIGRGRTTNAPNDAGPVQFLQLSMSELETRDGTPRVAEFGFTSAPPEGTDAVVVFLCGNRKTGIVIATNNQKFRPVNLNPGEMMIYDAFGKSIYLTENNGIVVNANGAPVTVNDSPLTTINGNLFVNGNLGASSGMTTVLTTPTGQTQIFTNGLLTGVI